MELSQQKIRLFQKKILSWYKVNKRDLPWRRTENPYLIMVSEVMLQQTQVSRVIPKYDAWIKVFPTVATLARAQTVDVLRLWSGLGYNRRALNLQKAAQAIVKEYGGVFPSDLTALKQLPGIGEYTARAIMSFAFDEQIAVVDTNVRKVILTQFQMPQSTSPISNKMFQEIADQLLPKGKARDWNQALMDYASAVLKKEKISIKKQTPYVGSKRYFRGKILKLLLTRNEIKISEIREALKGEHSVGDESWLIGIIEQLRREGFIKCNGKKVSLVS